jgi:hypothetical protein
MINASSATSISASVAPAELEKLSICHIPVFMIKRAA